MLLSKYMLKSSYTMYLCRQWKLCYTPNCRCSRRNPFHIKVYLDADETATGNLFWDDGDSIGNYISIFYF